MKVLAVVLIGCLWVSMAVAEAPAERVVWDYEPIRVRLPVGEERLVHFPADEVQVGVPDGLPLRTMSVDGVVYWQARRKFGKRRVIVKGLGDDGGRYLLDVEAVADGSTSALKVMEEKKSNGDGGETERSRKGAHQNKGYVALMRFASQQMYAPERLRPDSSGFRRVSLGIDALRLVRGGGVSAEPIISWRRGDLYVTAVRLQNETDEAVVLDPRNLRGEWLAATFQHGRLLPAGDIADTTAVYLISDRAFGESVSEVK